MIKALHSLPAACPVLFVGTATAGVASWCRGPETRARPPLQNPGISYASADPRIGHDRAPWARPKRAAAAQEAALAPQPQPQPALAAAAGRPLSTCWAWVTTVSCHCALQSASSCSGQAPSGDTADTAASRAFLPARRRPGAAAAGAAGRPALPPCAGAAAGAGLQRPRGAGAWLYREVQAPRRRSCALTPTALRLTPTATLALLACCCSAPAWRCTTPSGR